MLEPKYFLNLSKLSHLNDLILKIQGEYKQQGAQVYYWSVGGFDVSYGSLDLRSEHLSEFQKSFEIPLQNCSFVFRAPKTYFFPHKDRGGRQATIITNLSKDRSALAWYRDQSFDHMIVSTEISVPTLINTQRDFHGIKGLSDHWRKTFQIEFREKTYNDLYKIFRGRGF